MPLRPNKRFWTSTRGRIVLLLRRGHHTVSELAEALHLTSNAVRAHVTGLERDGLVRPSGKRPGLRKPIVTYGLTPEAEQLFPKLYGPILRHVLDVLQERLTMKRLDEIVRAIAHRMAVDYRPIVQASRSRDRGEQAALVLHELGGFCEPEHQDGRVILCCSDCPLSAVVAGHPEVCVLMETVLTEVLGVPVQQRCRAEPQPQCRFEIEDGLR